MKKTFTINISGVVFYIEEPAWEVLNNYLLSLKKHFGNGEEGKEIVSDIEARIAEIFSEKTSDKKQVVTLEWVEEVIETLGTPESFEEETYEEEMTGNEKRNKRLYRDPQQSVLGGVCGGLAAYLNMDPVVVRLIFVLLFLITSGVISIVYLILWIAVPKAVSTAQRLEMMGEAVTVKNIEKFIKEEVDAVKESYKKFRKSRFFSRK